MKKIILCLNLLLLIPLSTRGQLPYYRIDLSTGHLFSFALANMVGGGVNMLTKTMLIDNSFSYANYQLQSNNDAISIERYSPIFFSAKDMFQDILFGGRYGCQSFLPESWCNWALMGTIHYKVNQFQTNQEDILSKHSIHRLLIGGELMLILGDMSKETQAFLEANVRYDIPLRYSGGVTLAGEGVLNSGLSTRLGIRFNGRSWVQGLGAYVEIPHYSQFKEETGIELKIFTFGLIYTITPWKYIRKV